MDFLMAVRKRVGPVVDALRLRPLASRVYRRLLGMRYGAGGLAVARQNGRTWKLDPEVALRGEYAEFETVEWLRSVVQPGDCVLDIGANVGQMTLEAAELVGPGGKVIAVEPAPGNLRLLRRHVEANGFAGRVEVVAAACGAEHGGTLTLHVVGDADAVGSGHSAVPGAAGELPTVAVSVPLVSVDGLCRDRGLAPAVVKVDVEGAELDVLRGATDTFGRCRPRLRVGFHPFAFPDRVTATEQVRATLAGYGYAVPPAPPGGYELDEYNFAPEGRP